MSAAFGIIGYPLSHSFSPAYFSKKFAAQRIDATYTAYPLRTVGEYPALLKIHPELLGLNVTLPYKETIISYLDELDDTARGIGAVNCIHINDGVQKGYNTDAIGFEKSLLPLLRNHHIEALILGTGGSSKAVAYVLRKLGISHTKVSRKPKGNMLGYEQLSVDVMQRHKLIINTTSAGMYPNMNDAPAIPYKLLDKECLLYDLIYNPAETKFLALGKEQGATIKNGYEMLQLQADASWEIWNRK
ncbi:MAG: shikimate dehydrogenase [Bacteroidetes bacterium]|nr:shikimate dehydrogenase [Bacteroidota bacterium]